MEPKALIYRCKCGRIRKYGKWLVPDNEMKLQIFRAFGQIEVIDGTCPMCKVTK